MLCCVVLCRRRCYQNAMCVTRTLCVVCVRRSSLLCHFVAAAGPVRLGGLVRLPWLRHVGGAAFAPCPPLRPPRRRTLGRTGCTAHCVTLWAGAAVVLLLVLPWRCYWALEPTPAPVPIEGLWGCCTREQFSGSSSRAVAGSNCGGAAALSLRLFAAYPCPVTNQGAIGVMLDPGALLVVGGPGPGARPPMGVCRPASLPLPSLALRMFLGGGGPWCSLPFWGGCCTACCPPIVVGDVVHGPAVPCCAVLCRAALCPTVPRCVGGRRTILYPARRWWYPRKRGSWPGLNAS